MESRALKSEALLRFISVVLASLTALLVGLDKETKTVFFMKKQASVKDLVALWVLTIIASAAAGYQLLQFCRCLVFAWLAKNPCGSNKFVAWLCLLLDQGSTYAIFAGTVAVSGGAAVAFAGVSNFQWSKACNIYTRFCVQMGGGLLCGLLASLAMAVVSSISAHHLFRLYPSNLRPPPYNAR